METEEEQDEKRMNVQRCSLYAIFGIPGWTQRAPHSASRMKGGGAPLWNYFGSVTCIKVLTLFILK